MTTPAQRLTPRKTPVQHRSVETRARILDAAARVFGDHGYAAGTTNRIAAEAGLSVGSLYQYFPNKDSILVELVRRHLDEGFRAVTERLAAVETDRAGSTLRLIGAAVDAAIGNHVDDPGLHQVLFEESPRPPELLAELHALETLAIDQAAAILAADPDVRVADPALAARVVVTTIESVVHRVIATRARTVDVAAFRHELVTMIERYLFSPAGQAARR
jgi:AcrR family transcriptional regulator